MRSVVAAAAVVAAMSGTALAAQSGIPKPDVPACRIVATSAISAVVGEPATRQTPGAIGNDFQLSRGPSGRALLISLCSWTHGQADPSAPSPVIPTISITYFAAASRVAATVEYGAIKKMGASRWSRVAAVGEAAAVAASAPSGQAFAASAIARQKNEILKVDIVTPTRDPAARDQAVVILRKAAARAWRS